MLGRGISSLGGGELSLPRLTRPRRRLVVLGAAAVVSLGLGAHRRPGLSIVHFSTQLELFCPCPELLSSYPCQMLKLS
jgi:hypothetical protein